MLSNPYASQRRPRRRFEFSYRDLGKLVTMPGSGLRIVVSNPGGEGLRVEVHGHEGRLAAAPVPADSDELGPGWLDHAADLCIQEMAHYGHINVDVVRRILR